jgi:hypothetical protein
MRQMTIAQVALSAMLILSLVSLAQTSGKPGTS